MATIQARKPAPVAKLPGPALSRPWAPGAVFLVCTHRRLPVGLYPQVCPQVCASGVCPQVHVNSWRPLHRVQAAQLGPPVWRGLAWSLGTCWPYGRLLISTQLWALGPHPGFNWVPATASLLLSCGPVAPPCGPQGAREAYLVQVGGTSAWLLLEQSIAASAWWQAGSWAASWHPGPPPPVGLSGIPASHGLALSWGLWGVRAHVACLCGASGHTKVWGTWSGSNLWLSGCRMQLCPTLLGKPRPLFTGFVSGDKGGGARGMQGAVVPVTLRPALAAGLLQDGRSPGGQLVWGWVGRAASPSRLVSALIQQGRSSGCIFSHPSGMEPSPFPSPPVPRAEGASE